MTGPRTALVVFVSTLLADLGSKAYFVAHEDSVIVVYNLRDGRLGSRLVLSLVAIAVAYALSRLARWRGYGELWGVWIGLGLLLAGVVGNGVSRFLWIGVPDFIFSGDHIWNLADFAIGFGLMGGILSIFASALLAYVRGKIHVARP